MQEEADAEAQHEPRRYQAADHQIKDDAIAGKGAAEGETGEEGKDHGRHRDDGGELHRALERALDVAGAHLGEQVDEPVQREALHRENQAAADILKRQDVDADHRPVEGEDVEHEHRAQRIKGPWPPTAARSDGVRHYRPRHWRGDRVLGHRHCASSLRMSTLRKISATNRFTTIVTTTALAAAHGYSS